MVKNIAHLARTINGNVDSLVAYAAHIDLLIKSIRPANINARNITQNIFDKFRLTGGDFILVNMGFFGVLSTDATT
jgi:hypothetical protein